MKIMKKLYACLLTSLLMFSAIIPVSAKSGKCGSKATYNLASGTLTISGKGAIKDYGDSSDYPWAYETIKKVVIKDGITSIPKNAFRYCDVTTISIPKSVTKIVISAFSQNYKLKSFKVDASNKYFSAFEDVLFNKKQTTLLKYPNAKKDKIYSIPSSVKTIGKEALYDSKCNSDDSNIVEWCIPTSVKTIQSDNFGIRDTINYYGSKAQWLKINNKDDLATFNPIYLNYKEIDSSETVHSYIAKGKTASINMYSNTLHADSYKSSNTNIATITNGGKITGKNYGVTTITASYSGEDGWRTNTFKVKVVPTTQKFTSVKAKGGKKASVKWAKVSGTYQYQVQYSTTSDFKHNTLQGTFKNTVTSIPSLSGLKKGKGYFRVRRMIKSGGKTYKSNWSAPKTITVK